MFDRLRAVRPLFTGLGFVMWVLKPAVVLAVTPGAGLDLVPHRAVYDMRLDEASISSGITSLAGRMVFEFQGSVCEGYTQTMRLVTNVVDRSGRLSLSDLRTSSWEAAAGNRFRFNSTTLRDSRLTEIASGNVARTADKKIHIELTKPSKDQLSLDETVMFPAEHSRALLAAARSGGRFLNANIYDGSEKGKKIFATTSVVGNRIAPGGKKIGARIKSAARLDSLSSWPVSISYYDIDQKRDDGVPNYQMAFRYFENGVTRGLKIDYGNFVVLGSLTDIEFFESTDCSKSE